MSSTYYLVEPLDVLLLRGNRSFGGAGDHGEAVIPPWPSVFAGAFRSALLGQDAGRLAAYVAIAGNDALDQEAKETRLRAELGDAIAAALGTPRSPGAFRITWLSLAHEGRPVMPLPADLLAFSGHAGGGLELLPLDPAYAVHGPLPMRALPRMAKQQKPTAGAWLDESALSQYLAGQVPAASLLTRQLYATETRLGIGLSQDTRTVESGALYTTEAIALRPEAGFLVGVHGLGDLLPEQGVLRLGGDGKGASYRRVPFQAPVWAATATRFRLVLTSPAIFAQGWLPDGVALDVAGTHRLQGSGFSARLACAAVPRNDVVSGWDLAAWKPKAAQRVVPAGSVYWFDEFEGDAGKLASWVADGVWGDTADRQRRAEGFNLALLGEWR